MRRTMLAIGLGLVVLSCETKEHAEAEMQAVKRAKEVARQAGSHLNTSASDEETGVAECDDYVRKMNRCLDEKIPADEQPAVRFQLD